MIELIHGDCLEEMVEKFIKENGIVLLAEYTKGDVIGLQSIRIQLENALTQAHQAGIDEAVEKFRQILVELHNNKQSELHGGYDDADFLTAYCFSLQEAMQRLQALQDNQPLP